MAQDLAHRKHPVQCLETVRKRVASEQESPIHLRGPGFSLFSDVRKCLEHYFPGPKFGYVTQ